ncbi:nucleotide sugar dehydrogenase [Prochlorococcus marinus]|uniref:nucleotide sugar dehydrogenase n=1 Tax=Prochlorococcus marinus TaxID=1219 RepID=UPI0022B40DBD|nr:nucleotide sugar dehydrogenase [Prochlorococcus marinus]
MECQIKNICCIGAGYVGGPTMAVIAQKCPHIQVNVVDINRERIRNWNEKDLERLPIYEPGLKKIIEECRGENLHFSNEVEKNIETADMIFISVNTPTKKKGIGAGQASDLKWIEASARKIAEYANGKTIVVEKSTLPVKTAEVIKNILEFSNVDQTKYKTQSKSFTVLSNPEFLSEGTAIKDLENPDRVLIGGDNEESIKALVNIYLNWVDETKILTTDLWSSELSKLTANAFLAQRISSINSISALCESTGADINDVATAIGADKRIGSHFLQSGPGFGGSCFKKDILNLIYICNHYGLNHVSSYWIQVLEINNWQKKRISNIVVNKLFGTISGKKIAVLGFAFKANTNDTRESAAIDICKDLIEEGANLNIYDPKVSLSQIENDLFTLKTNNQINYPIESTVTICKLIIEAIKDSDAIIVLTEWEEFKHLNWEEISSLMRKPSWLFDTRSICDLKKAKSYGINVWRVGMDNEKN